MTPTKHEQLSLGEYHDLQAKKRKKFIDLPWPVKLLCAVPLVIFVILLLGYIFYIRRFVAHG
jgi:hypothetical protein